jgi:hypothetical protein
MAPWSGGKGGVGIEEGEAGRRGRGGRGRAIAGEMREGAACLVTPPEPQRQGVRGVSADVWLGQCGSFQWMIAAGTMTRCRGIVGWDQHVISSQG